MTNIYYYTPKLYWLGLNLILIFLMVTIGGITRLTDSGLSMTEWSLIGGIIPPLTEYEWTNTFQKYKDSPEFILKNYDMTLSEFKKIFFWEYFHRIWGRLIGVTYVLPLAAFWIMDKLTNFEKKFYIFLLLLGVFQAFMGWFMVESGLVDIPDVSHFRLSAHLILAFLIYSSILFIFFLTLRLKSNIDIKLKVNKSNFSNFICLFSIALTFLTIMSGAFVAGTNAGWAFNNFPYMGENLMPPILIDSKQIIFQKLFYDIGFIQFFHRILASTTLIFLIITSFYLMKNATTNLVSFLSKLLLILIVTQYLLGILILRLYVPIPLGVMHQLGSLILLSTMILILSENLSLGATSSSRMRFKLIKNFY